MDASWSGLVDGEYNVAAGYSWLLGERGTFRFHKLVWHKLLAPKHVFILWLVLLRKPLTLDRVQSWGVNDVNDTCILCGSGRESIPHLFFSSYFSSTVMRDVASGLQCDSFPIGHNKWRAWLGFSGHCNNFKLSIWQVASAAGVYHIWTELNDRRHGCREKQVSRVVMQIKVDIMLRIPLCRMRRMVRDATDYIVQFLIS